MLFSCCCAKQKDELPKMGVESPGQTDAGIFTEYAREESHLGLKDLDFSELLLRLIEIKNEDRISEVDLASLY